MVNELKKMLHLGILKSWKHWKNLPKNQQGSSFLDRHELELMPVYFQWEFAKATCCLKFVPHLLKHDQKKSNEFAPGVKKLLKGIQIFWVKLLKVMRVGIMGMTQKPSKWQANERLPTLKTKKKTSQIKFFMTIMITVFFNVCRIVHLEFLSRLDCNPAI